MIFVDSIDKLRQNLRDGAEITLVTGKYEVVKPVEIKGLKNVNVWCHDGVEIYGTAEVFPQFEEWKNGIKRARLDYNNISALIVDGISKIIARFPAYNADAVLNGACSIDEAPIDEWENLSGGRIRALHEFEWGGNSYEILGKKTGKGWDSFETKWVGDNNRGGKPNLNKLVFENFPDLIKNVGEWCYSAGYLYYYPKGNEKQFVAVVNHCVFNIVNSTSIAINGAVISDTATTVFSFPYETPLRGDWGIQRQGAIKISDSNDITLKNIEMKKIGGNAIFVDGNSSDCIIENCEFTDSGASGIIFAGRESSCRDYSTWSNHKETISDFIAGPQNNEYVKNCVVKNCYFHNLGLYEKQSAAVCISISDSITVTHCTAHRLPRAAINISDGTFGGHIIEFNELFDCVRETCDHGPFNSWGRDRFWSLKKYNTSGKFGEIKKQYALLDAVKPNKIINNRINATKGFGIDLDDGSSNYIIQNNVCIGVGIKIREGFYRNVSSNAFFHSTLDVHCSFYKCDDIAENNAFIASKHCLNTILMNKGNNFTMRNNFYIDSVPPRKYEASPIIVNSEIIDYYDYSWIKDLTDGKVDISSNIGAFIKTAKPLVNVKSTYKNSIHRVIDGIVFIDIDESLRSACVLPETAGAYVERFKFLAKKRGLKKRDVIININGEKINTIKDLQKGLNGEVTIIREQKQIIIKKE